ncbi:MAG: 4Fe-4S dicluster domain-containing protein [Clostridia bacterium]|nr:4Fe-4S dicluster domain-containing protein [Clostridia bacterium]
MYKTAKEKLPAVLDAISRYFSLYLPVDYEDGAVFEAYSYGKTLSSKVNTVKSPKEYFFPQTETLVNFKVDGKSLSIIDPRRESEDFVIFGMRACDVKSLAILDRVFLSDPIDTYYENRRRHGIIVSMACSKPAATCFCTTFGIDPSEPDGDAILYLDKDTLYLNIKTEKGAKLLTPLQGIIVDCEQNEVDTQKNLIRERLKKLPLSSLQTTTFSSGKTDDFFSSEVWETLSDTCLGCGSCTYVCPTCHCYDIKDFKTADGIRRFRCWDSCMFSDFTQMSHGNPRTKQSERFRQRFMHKLVYYPTNHDGIFSCVGCGRCLKSCPINMNIVKVMKALGGEGNGKQ